MGTVLFVLAVRSLQFLDWTKITVPIVRLDYLIVLIKFP